MLLRGSREFARVRKEYAQFLQQLIDQLNRGRRQRLQEELEVMGRLPSQRLEAVQRLRVRVSPGSTINLGGNTYSVHSRVIGE